MTNAEFIEKKNLIACWQCHKTGTLEIEVMPAGHVHHAKVRCRACDTFQRWLAKDRPENRHPKFRRGEVEKAWEEGGNHCAHCGLSVEELTYLGVGLTGKHCPPCSRVEEARYVIPLCAWCQQHSAAEMRRLTALVKRLREPHGHIA